MNEATTIPATSEAGENKKAASKPLYSYTGEPLSGLTRYGVTISDLSRWNRIDRNDVLKVGARIAVAPPPSSGG